MVAALAAALLPMVAPAPASAAPAQPKGPWTRVAGKPAASKAGRPADIRAKRVAAYTLDRASMTSTLGSAPKQTARTAAPLVVSLPTPAGDLQRFELADSPVMEAGLAAKHPEIKTYAGKGIDDPLATVRADLTPLGFHASVRSPHGAWYVDPYYNRDQALYVSYYGRDLTDSHGEFVEREDVTSAAQALQEEVAAAGAPVSLRTYRVALVTDPSYATFFGADNVTAAKVTLMNRVTQIYEDETAIRLVLINDTDKTNLNSPALATEPNGPCGAAACFTPAQLAGCAGGTLNRNRIVLGQLVGASNYDVGHLGLGVNGGGVAGLGVIGGDGKARGCTGLPTPVGDFYAVDYVAHEMGHQFGGNHTFNGTQLNCSGGNRSAANSVEPGSGSSIMAYAGICRQDDLQPHSDPYWSQRSYTEITTYVTSSRPAINEVQTVSLREFDTDGDSFTIGFGGTDSAPIVRGTTYTTTDLKAAIEAIAPAGTTVTVAAFGGGAGALTDDGFQVAFNGGPLAATNVDALALTNLTGASGFVGETAKGGAIDNGGNLVEETGNHTPVVTVPDAVTIPVRTPFSLTGSATDSDGDPVTYLWEQNDRGGISGGSTAGTALVSNVKTSGPLFRQFGTAAVVSPTDTLEYYSPGENAVSTNPTRVFPDLAQIAAGNTNAADGTCPPAPPPPTSGGSNVPPEIRDCLSEFLPTADWVGFNNDRTMHFRLTARDAHPGGGGVGNAETAITLAPESGPFLVTSQATTSTVEGGTAQEVTWAVAGTDVAPVNAAAVRVSLSVDGGATFPYVLAESTPNDGGESVTLPNVGTAHGRIRIEAVGNIFFDLNDADIAINAAPVVSHNAPSTVQYSDALSPAVTVSASDPDTSGVNLSATAAGLPSGLSLAVASTSGDDSRPGTRTWTVAGTTTAAPGAYPVTVTVTDDTGVARTTSFTITVTAEDADATYTGDLLAFGANGATVLLRATVRDSSAFVGSNDHAPGDIRNATVTFKEGGKTLCTAPVGPLGSAATVGSASCGAPLSRGSHTITAVVGNYYTGGGSALVKVAKPDGARLTGDGNIRSLRSAGSYPASPGSRTDFAFEVKSGKSLTGYANVEFHSGGRTYELRGTAFDSFGADAAGHVEQADFRARATLKDVTNPRHPTTVASGLTLQVTATDRGHPGSADSVAITVWNGSTLVFSSEWTGARTQEIRLAGGNLVVH
ncbi:M12 family metallo-peptidase [Asanoa ferruginea]|uniref:M12 family metallo-peptidase n=1 Tax=Asanoa ferruginea TaxID=53367 RepID=UPI001EF28297|nr:M12 family metallo-peptidase [Asanoa ferruginea]